MASHTHTHTHTRTHTHTHTHTQQAARAHAHLRGLERLLHPLHLRERLCLAARQPEDLRLRPSLHRIELPQLLCLLVAKHLDVAAHVLRQRLDLGLARLRQRLLDPLHLRCREPSRGAV